MSYLLYVSCNAFGYDMLSKKCVTLGDSEFLVFLVYKRRLSSPDSAGEQSLVG